MRGTAVLSRLLGGEFGVAKSITPVLVKTSNRFGEIEPREDNILNTLPKILRDIKEKSSKVDISSKQAPKFIVLITIGLKFGGASRAFSSRMAQFSQLVQELGEMPNVAIVTSADDIYYIDKSHNPTLKPIDSYPALFGTKDEDFTNFMIVGGTNVESGEIESHYAEFIHISAPSTNVSIAIPDEKSSWSGGNYKKATGAPLAAAAVTGVLATLLSAKDYTMPEAISKLYKLSYPRGPPPGSEKSGAIYPNVIYNGMSLLTETPDYEPVKEGPKEVSGKSPMTITVVVTIYPQGEHCARVRRGASTKPILTADVTEYKTVTKYCKSDGRPKTISAHITTAAQAISTPTFEQPGLEYQYSYHSGFCEECLESNGEMLLGGILWIPSDCPCRDREA
ncbi:hypothetical protein TWF730_007415 [Orbilia blumenaviensis]|uniref:Peptidase S8/S53 domain-containing protein n=1 Tax=Orbilia blumenaviensis TaxID=1796055 RepID=A0AAV9VE58_9PEZI